MAEFEKNLNLRPEVRVCLEVSSMCKSTPSFSSRTYFKVRRPLIRATEILGSIFQNKTFIRLRECVLELTNTGILTLSTEKGGRYTKVNS